jgi:uncharacterized protein
MQQQPTVKYRTIKWDGIADQTHEIFLISLDDEWKAKGTITGIVEGKPVDLSYSIEIDNLWQVHTVNVNSADGRALAFVKRKDGWYDQDGLLRKDLNHCIDVDLTLTPFTNTLPIRRLKLRDGESAEIDVVYFEVEKWEVRPAPQRYTRLNKNTYHFESLDIDFNATLKVDDDGFIIDYPELFKRAE